MQDLYLIEGETLRRTADAIRTRRGTIDPIDPVDYEAEILSIQGGGGESNPFIANTEAEMAALMTEGNIGKFIKYVGPNGTYVNGECYKVVAGEPQDTTQYYTYKSQNDIAPVFFIQESAKVFSLYLLPIPTERDVVTTIQTDNLGNVEVIINEQ